MEEERQVGVSPKIRGKYKEVGREKAREVTHLMIQPRSMMHQLVVYRNILLAIDHVSQQHCPWPERLT